MFEWRRPADVKVLLVAEEAAGIQTLRAILNSRHRLVGVVTSDDEGARRGATVRGVAESNGCQLWPAQSVGAPDFAQVLREAGVDVLLNVHSLRLIHPAILRVPVIGSFNLHPGPLPEYSGLNAPSWAIYNGEPRHAVTVHWMTSEIDTGPIAFREELLTDEQETGLTLTAKCVRAGVPLLLRLLDVAGEDPTSIPRLAQDRTRRRYYGREVPQNGCLRWHQPAERIVRFVRACDYAPLPSPWGYPRTGLNGKACEIVKAFRTRRPCSVPAGTVGEIRDASALIATADEWVEISRLNVAGRAMRAADVLKTGARLED
ncbi:MAG: methionyl-tRNA formyltransferase [Betaproteobacteria bacterium]